MLLDVGAQLAYTGAKPIQNLSFLKFVFKFFEKAKLIKIPGIFLLLLEISIKLSC